MIGSGKYDLICSELRRRTKAKGAMVIILDGNKGSGFSCQLPADSITKIPDALRQMATEIEKDQLAGKF